MYANDNVTLLGEGAEQYEEESQSVAYEGGDTPKTHHAMLINQSDHELEIVQYVWRDSDILEIANDMAWSKAKSYKGRNLVSNKNYANYAWPLYLCTTALLHTFWEIHTLYVKICDTLEVNKYLKYIYNTKILLNIIEHDWAYWINTEKL